MGFHCYFLAALIAGAMLFSQSGCQRQAALGQGTEPGLFAVKPSSETNEMRKAGAEIMTGKPAIVFKKVTCDFGSIGPLTRHMCSFEFTNTGNGLLKIEKVTKTCGCTPYELGKMAYLPGESGFLKVGYHSHEHVGPGAKRLEVYSNDPNTPKVVLTVKAVVEEKVRYEPERLKLALNEENAGCSPIILSSMDNQPFALQGFTSTDHAISADIPSGERATEFLLQPIVDVAKVRKRPRGEIRIVLDHPQCRRISIPFQALPEYKIIPESLFLLNAEPGKKVRKKLEIQSNYDEALEIETVSCDKSTVRVVSEKREGNVCKYELEVTPPKVRAGAESFSDNLSFTLKDGKKLKVRCLGFYSKKWNHCNRHVKHLRVESPAHETVPRAGQTG